MTGFLPFIPSIPGITKAKLTFLDDKCGLCTVHSHAKRLFEFRFFCLPIPSNSTPYKNFKILTDDESHFKNCLTTRFAL